MRGSTLAELVVACGLFSVFMVIALGLFSGMTRIVRTEQRPSEEILEARLALLHVAQRIRNCQALVQPVTWDLINGSSDTVCLRDRVLKRAVRLNIEDQALRETQFALDYDLEKPTEFNALKQRKLTAARRFSLLGGGIESPTRVTITIVTINGREMKAVTNFREAI